MDRTASLHVAHEAYRSRDWTAAFRSLAAVDAEAPLAATDLERLATAAHLTGHEDVGETAWERAHRLHLAHGDAVGAVRCAFWLGFGLVMRGEVARGSGWLARADRLCEVHALDCAERGYLGVAMAIRHLDAGHAETALEHFDRVLAVAERFADADVGALGMVGRGQSLLQLGQIEEGFSLLDEVMLRVTSDEVSARVAGIVYCAVVDECQRMFDVGRAREWTQALVRWCEAQPGLVPYRGQCLVHRSQLLLLDGDWEHARAEAERARDWLTHPPHPAVGMAHYQLGELHRLHGRDQEALASFEQAAAAGHSPHPGLALLWLRQGRVPDAVAAIRTALGEAATVVERVRLLPGALDVLLGAGHHDEARAIVEELAEAAAERSAPLLAAVAARGRGALLLAEGDAPAALAPLRTAAMAWRALGADHELARTHALLAQAYGACGDTATAEVEAAAARDGFGRLGASPDLVLLDAPAGVDALAGLTPREVEVLRGVSRGRTNQQIADDLVISPRTVERHLTNIYTKLGLSNRAAATAWAYEHDLVGGA